VNQFFLGSKRLSGKEFFTLEKLQAPFKRLSAWRLRAKPAFRLSKEQGSYSLTRV